MTKSDTVCCVLSLKATQLKWIKQRIFILYYYCSVDCYTILKTKPLLWLSTVEPSGHLDYPYAHIYILRPIYSLSQVHPMAIFSVFIFTFSEKSSALLYVRYCKQTDKLAYVFIYYKQYLVQQVNFYSCVFEILNLLNDISPVLLFLILYKELHCRIIKITYLLIYCNHKWYLFI